MNAVYATVFCKGHREEHLVIQGSQGFKRFAIMMGEADQLCAHVSVATQGLPG